MKSRQNYFLSPRFWPWWLLIGILWFLVKLPYSLQIKIGRCLGFLLQHCARRMRHITVVNLQRCFPELSERERQVLLKENFESLGISVLETALAYWAPDEKLRSLITIHGMGHLQAAIAKGKGVIMIGTHFTTLQMIGRLMLLHLPFAVVYRRQKNPFLNYLTSRIVRPYKKAILRGDMREMMACLQENIPIWYTPDVDAGLRNSVFVPFFGIPAASITATARLAKLTGAAVVTGGYYRRDDLTGYDIEINPVLENFPSEDIAFDTARINQAQETAIRKKPQQYIWQYKRFKTRPPGEQRFY